jgi:hypothetical protein
MVIHILSFFIFPKNNLYWKRLQEIKNENRIQTNTKSWPHAKHDRLSPIFDQLS